MIYYKIDTTGGQSGCPIFTIINGRQMVIGIHKGWANPS